MKRNTPETIFERITPKIAQQYLDTMGKNRSLRRSSVKGYARDMAAGSWQTSHQGVAFDATGKLVDGQHRLAAIIEAGVTVEMAVTRGLDEGAIEAIDVGIRRGVHDVLKISGIEEASPRFVAITKKFLTGRAGVQQQGAQTIHELKDAVVLHQDALAFAYNTYGNRQKGLGQAAVPASIARASYHIPHEKLRRFAEVLQSGMPDSKEERIILVLRNWILENALSKLSSDAVYAKVEKCIELFAKGESPTMIYQSPNELFPLPTEPQDAFLRMEGAESFSN